MGPEIEGGGAVTFHALRGGGGGGGVSQRGTWGLVSHLWRVREEFKPHGRKRETHILFQPRVKPKKTGGTEDGLREDSS